MAVLGHIRCMTSARHYLVDIILHLPDELDILCLLVSYFIHFIGPDDVNGHFNFVLLLIYSLRIASYLSHRIQASLYQG